MSNSSFINRLVVFCKRHPRALVGGLAGLLALEVAMLLVVKPGIDRDILTRTSGLLDQSGYKRIDVQVSGREVVLNGAVSGTSAESTALEVAESVYGVRSVTSNLELSPLRLPHLKVSRTPDNNLKLEGEVPTQYLVDRFIELAKSTVSHQDFVSLLLADPEVMDPQWVDAVKAVMVEGNYLSGMEIEIGAGQLSLGGLMADAAGYGVLIKRIQQFSRDQNLSFTNRIGIMPATEYLQGKESGSSENKSVISESATFDENKPIESASESQLELKSDQNQPGPEISSVEPLALLNKEGVEETTIQTENDQIAKSGNEIGADDRAISEDQYIARDDSEVAVRKSIPELEYCQAQLNNVISSNPLTFTPNSAIISVDNHTIIEKLYNFLLDCPTYDIFIGGHTDSRGDTITNRILSIQRAEAVMKAMIELGVDSNRISAAGFGATRPIASNETTAGRQRNRRIEFILTSE
jgi:OOP family OmpA-OmpF porin